MQVIRTLPHEKYDSDKVIEIFSPSFFERAHWTEESNYIPYAPGEKSFVLADDVPVGLGWRVREGVPIAPDVEVLEDVKADRVAEIVEELGVLDIKLLRSTEALTGALLDNDTPDAEDKAKFDELQARKTELRTAIAQIEAAETIEAAKAVTWEQSPEQPS
jgi:hypothetical protein